LGAEVSTEEVSTAHGEEFVVDARLGEELKLRVVVCDDDPDVVGAGQYCIMCTRLVGDTSDFHAAYCKLGELIEAQNFAARSPPSLRLFPSPMSAKGASCSQSLDLMAMPPLSLSP
jgi:hypothetical protein